MGDVCETGCQGLVNMPKVETRGVSWGRGGGRGKVSVRVDFYFLNVSIVL